MICDYSTYGSTLPFVLIKQLCAGIAEECLGKNFGQDSIVCVCNATYCDTEPSPTTPEANKFIWYATTKGGKRLYRTDGVMDDYVGAENTITINPKLTYQTIIGFGGAFTDSFGINMAQMSKDTQNNIMKAYYSSEGSNYNFGRVPIGGTDFSKRGYTLDDIDDDTDLKFFSLSSEDMIYRVLYLKKAFVINPSTLFYATSWTAPPWMKSNDDFVGFANLKTEYYQAYADYIIKWLDAYQAEGLRMWGLSTGNEPTVSWIPTIRINSMQWTPVTLARWLAKYLGPSLANSQHNGTFILAVEDERFALPWFVEDMKAFDPIAIDYISGVAVHWYADTYIVPEPLDQTHDKFPSKFIFLTESCMVPASGESPVILGSWARAAKLALKMIENFNHWIVGWMEWNLALNLKGGPTWVKNNVDASIIVDPSKDVFYKQPTYYVLAHFSKFVPRGAVKIYSKSEDSCLPTVAFKTVDQIIVILHNQCQNQYVSIMDSTQIENTINLEIPENSIHTIIYKINQGRYD